MKFYNREKELELLESTWNLSKTGAKMTIVTGRRRIGKTSLILKAVEDKPFVYFFASKKSEKLLCEEYIKEINRKLNLRTFGEINSFPVLFEFLLKSSKENHFTLIIDEFQEFYNINPSIFSEMQKLWDLYKNISKINLIISGSVQSLMFKIFENVKEPLFGRANEFIYLKSFNSSIIKEIILDNKTSVSNKDILTSYIITGGVAKYLEILVEKNCLDYNSIINEIFKENSLWLNEGKNLLIEEFGRDYTTYFSIISLISESKTSRSEIESILQKNVGGYLDKLEKDYNLIKSIKPIFAKVNSRNQKYFINDNFLNFWFRFVYKNLSAIEMNNFEYVKIIVDRDFATYSGLFLEKWFKDKLSISGEFSKIGSFWDKKGNEIDIVAINEFEKKALIAEVKINKSKIDLNLLKEKAKYLMDDLKNYSIEYKGFSLEDM